MKRMKCPHCGHDEFYASQGCRGSVTVIATVYDAGGTVFASNITENGSIATDGLDFDDPEGPFQCVKCSKEMDEDELSKSEG